jgi:heterotetrameric sarcosine oxidase gamma subunit
VSGFKCYNATLQERADIGCVLLTSAVNADEIVNSAMHVCGVEIPLVPGAVQIAAGRAALWLSPRSWLIQCEVEDEAQRVTRLNAAFPDALAHAVSLTDALCWFELSGPGSLTLLTEGGFVSLERDGLPVGHAKRTLIAQVAAVVARESEVGWLIGVERSRARYFVEWLSAASLTGS